MGWLGGALGGIGGFLVGGPAGAMIGANLGSSYDQNQNNKEAQRDANNANVNLWREQAAYNTPVNQVKRLEEAGLSPQLAYGQVAESKMANAPTMQPVHYQKPEFSLAEYQQIQNMQAANQLTRAQLEKTKIDTMGSKQDVRLKKQTADYYERTGGNPSEPAPVKTGRALMDYVQGVPDRVRSWSLEMQKSNDKNYQRHLENYRNRKDKK